MSSFTYEYKETLLKLSGVSMRRGENLILRDVDLEIKNLTRPGMQQGQIVALVGPSGAGKTTLFRLLAGLDEPDSGAILVGPDQKPVQRGTIGVVAQNYPLFAHRTVLGNLLVAGKQAGLKGAENRQKAEKLLERFGIADHGAKYPAQLSGGQRQRAAIAQQFMCSEHFLLMDEPFSGLDMLAQEAVIRFIHEMAEIDELMTFILITHDISAALQVADTIWVLGRDFENGQNQPGARIRANFNLAERGLAWRENIAAMPEFLQVRQEIRDLFPTL
ncbi:polar amino acid transport system ATP-binding protein/sulfate transport system ATP-binding protein [Abditibacterium utsteinense]|uniref:Polar amino acid transport system ATP-binding protein/sulfate transport system ATP-binding protein n=1 Tax=Abditibacterium utsteinense TaxID=1960156 RepID=A0A2S8STN6_9BACT|nr:ABC transporter ATP-binding protein [Abditibacterium utsteinense]PQV64161.1 polar amino acid transport system ATP-binding protein/sulfate transport system ATP-binding protein [Abditibacterium utsteinense]